LDGKYGHDLGRNFVSQPSQPMSSYLDRNSSNYRARHQNLSDYFRQIRDVFKSRVVRVWGFEGGEGLRFSGSIVQMDSTMAPNIQSILSIAQREQLFIYWCLLSSHPDHNTAAFNKDIEIIRSAQNPGSSSFLNQALRSFCDAIHGSAHNFAIDVINEPEKYIARGSLSWSDIQQYIRECCRKIKGYLGQSFLVSCGSAGTGWVNARSVVDTLKNYLGLGLDFYDFHIYNDTGQLPMSYDKLYQKLGGRLDKPCIIGEFGQHRDGFLDDFQKGLVKNFVEQSWHLGFGGSLVWNYNYKNFDYNERNTKHKQSLIYRNGSPRPVKDPMNSFATDYNPYLGLQGTAVQTANSPLNIWLMEYNNAFTGYNTGTVHREIISHLDNWFTQVIQHANAQSSIPPGYTSRVAVQWATTPPQNVSERDLVIYFSPWNTSNPPNSGLAHAPNGPYRLAAQRAAAQAPPSDASRYQNFYSFVVREGNDPLLNTATGGRTEGSTLAFQTAIGNDVYAYFPVKCEVFVYYENPDATTMAQKWAGLAFHEAMHAKSTVVNPNIDIHRSGGGGLALDNPTTFVPNSQNIANMARWIWAWAPQYVMGQAVREYRARRDPAGPVPQP